MRKNHYTPERKAQLREAERLADWMHNVVSQPVPVVSGDYWGPHRRTAPNFDLKMEIVKLVLCVMAYNLPHPELGETDGRTVHDVFTMDRWRRRILRLFCRLIGVKPRPQEKDHMPLYEVRRAQRATTVLDVFYLEAEDEVEAEKLVDSTGPFPDYSFIRDGESKPEVVALPISSKPSDPAEVDLVDGFRELPYHDLDKALLLLRSVVEGKEGATDEARKWLEQWEPIGSVDG